MVPPSASQQGVCSDGAGWHAYTAVVCSGVDVLGTVYATYELSHTVLGINPQGVWVEQLKPQVVPTQTIFLQHTPVPGEGSISLLLACSALCEFRCLTLVGLLRVVSEDGAAVSTSPTFEYRGFFIKYV